MLETIAQALGADVNTVIYGIPLALDKKRMRILFCVALAVVAVLAAADIHLSQWARIYGSKYYDPLPAFWVNIVLGPLVCFLAGWTALQGLGAFAKLTPKYSSWSKWVRIAILLIVAAYFVLMSPYLLRDLLHWDPPQSWGTLAFGVLGALAGSAGIPWHLAFAFAFGAAFWLFPFRSAKDKQKFINAK